MRFETPLSWVPSLDDAIERHPLTVAPDASLVDAIALISQAHGRTCSLMAESPSSALSMAAGCASCVLVMQGRLLQGILTERDVVQLTAQAMDLRTVTVAEVMVHPVITLPEDSMQDLFAALFLFRRYRIRHLPIVDAQGQLVGVISHESIRQVLRPANLLRFRRVSDVMTTKAIHAPLTATVLRLAQLMAAHRVSCIVITQRDPEDNEQPVGIITERDIVQFQALQIDLGNTEAQTVMSSPLFLLSPEDSLWSAHQEMQERRVGRLVVSWNWGQGLGIVTQTSLLKVFDPMEMYGVIENLQQTIDQMALKQTTQLPSIAPVQVQPELVPLSTQAALAPPASPTSMDATERDRDVLRTLLDQIHGTVTHLLAQDELSVAAQQGQLRSILEILAQLQGHLNL